jgi:hypothetical protein
VRKVENFKTFNDFLGKTLKLDESEASLRFVRLEKL